LVKEIINAYEIFEKDSEWLYEEKEKNKRRKIKRSP
jgi:hypothetical protein